ncbi:hypothetical protein [Herbaspirillum sp. VT-16-41]|nr:hypothetical protein [Herbaspirillum sp. VT-16-41]
MTPQPAAFQPASQPACQPLRKRTGNAALAALQHQAAIACLGAAG